MKRIDTRLYLPVILSLLLIVSNGFPNARMIFLDGFFEDWNGIAPIYSDTYGDQGNGSIDFGAMYVANDNDHIYIRFSTGIDINLSENNTVYLYIDSDNNLDTGLVINTIGADFSIGFGERVGRYYGTLIQTFNLNLIGLHYLPSVTSNEFEISLPRNATYSGKHLFDAPIFRLLIINDVAGGGDQVPNTGEFASYTIDSTPVPAYPHIPLAKSEPSDIRILSYNVEVDGLFDRTESFSRILKALGPDIILFQELYSYTASQTKALITGILPLPEGEQWDAAKSLPDTITLARFPITSQWFIDGNLCVLLDVPPSAFDRDMLIVNAHLPCCGYNTERQEECDHIISFIRDAKLESSIAAGTALIIGGDMNFVGDKQQPITLLTGDIINESAYGADHVPDWDGTSLTDSLPYHSATANATTWRNPSGSFSPGRLDYLIYSDSVIDVVHSFILTTEEMAASELSAYGLLSGDTITASDHLPMIIDIRITSSQNIEGLYFY